MRGVWFGFGFGFGGGKGDGVDDGSFHGRVGVRET